MMRVFSRICTLSRVHSPCLKLPLRSPRGPPDPCGRGPPLIQINAVRGLRTLFRSEKHARKNESRSGFTHSVNRRSVAVLCFRILLDLVFLDSGHGGVRDGWTAGGGAELRLDQRWIAKIEYQFVDLGTQTVLVTANAPSPGSTPSSFNTAFHDQFHVVRIGLNYQFH